MSVVDDLKSQIAAGRIIFYPSPNKLKKELRREGRLVLDHAQADGPEKDVPCGRPLCRPTWIANEGRPRSDALTGVHRNNPD